MAKVKLIARDSSYNGEVQDIKFENGIAVTENIELAEILSNLFNYTIDFLEINKPVETSKKRSPRKKKEDELNG